MSGGLRIYDTLRRSKIPFETIEPGKVRMYVCGVTPYASSHVGHGMSVIVFDMIKRYLMERGYEVRHAQNFTDVDDKIINRANEEGIDPSVLTESLIAEWHKELASLNVLPADVYPRATLEIPNMIEMIEGLIANGHAYEVDGDVYFRVRSFEDYGKLSHRNLDDLQSGARIEIDERKSDPLDFALWKSAKPGEPRWESPWGQGRPGWHIECSAMCSHHLDGMVDIHGGGADLIFPHHENEIAQSEAYFEREPFARYWVHNGLMQLGGDKMSKSLGNIVQMREITARGLAPAFRLMVLQSHYRAPLTYLDESLLAAENGLDRLRAAAREATSVPGIPGHMVGELSDAVSSVTERFYTAMDDDFDSPSAIAALFDFARIVNRAKADGADEDAVVTAQNWLRHFSGVLGLDIDEEVASAGDAAPFIDLLVNLRQDLRSAKQWALADKIRDQLIELGITIEDQATGSIWRTS
jgi:cysteinyl-tRNA synthetase